MSQPNPARRLVLQAAAAPALAALPALPAAAQAPDPRRPLLIQGAHILSMDAQIGDLPRGDILIREGAIAGVAASIVPPDGAEVIAGAGRIALPGFVNGHIHLAQTLQRGLSTDHGFGAYFQTIVLRFSNRMTPEDVSAAVLAGALEQMALGTTTLVDWSRETMSPEHADAAAAAMLASGTRARLLYTVPLTPGEPLRERHAAHAGELARHLGLGRVQIGLCLPGPDFMPLDAALADLRRLRPLGLFTAYHTGAPIYANRKPRVIETLAREGLLDANTQIVHANDHAPDEYEIAARAGVKLNSTPEVELRMGHGHPAAFRAAAAGMAASLGTDIPSMVGGGMLPQARALMTAEQHRANQAGLARDGRVPAEPAAATRRVLELLTLEGARGVGLDAITGSLTPGKRADLLLVRSDAPATAPPLDAIGAVIWQASAGEIETVFVDGVAVKRGGRLTHPQAEAAFARAAERAAIMAERARG
jgi:cytosine/adenosine deaminase-related metal-dependent hydrolase